MQWFIEASKPLAGMEINVLSEDIPTHRYESGTLAKAFEEITGIKVNHQILGEGEVVRQDGGRAEGRAAAEKTPAAEGGMHQGPRCIGLRAAV